MSDSDKIKIDPSKTQFWVWFMHETINLNNNENVPQPHGWHWFWGLYYLQDTITSFDFDIEAIKDALPDRHWLNIEEKKSYSDDTHGKPIYIFPASRYKHNLIQDFIKSLIAGEGITEIKKIDFSKLSFENEIDFSNFIFPIDADFSKATFSKDVFFNNAVFCETADFEKATFQKKESYRKETAKFRNTIFEKIANFRNATFWGYANFKGSKLKGRAFFQEAKFKSHAPRFYDATFNNEITWAGIELPNFDTALVDEYKKVDEEFESLKCTECTNRVKCLKPVKCEVSIEENRRRRIEENQNAYENTSILLEKHRKYHDEHFFFREEMRCRRWLGSPFSKTIHFLYEKTADYGYGVGRALFYWALHIACGAYFIAWITSFFKASIYSKNVSCAISVSFANANPYIFFGSSGKKLIGCYEYFEGIMPINIAIINVVQNVIGVALLFLLLLTLRIRFRLK